MRHYAKMFRATLTALLILTAMVGTAVVTPFEDVIAGYDRGDYATALKPFRALAEQDCPRRRTTSAPRTSVARACHKTKIRR
jgi:hypothetical protein